MRKKSLKSVLTFVFALVFVLQTAFAAAVPTVNVATTESVEAELTENEQTSLVSDDDEVSFMFDENGELVELGDDFDYDEAVASEEADGAGEYVGSEEAVLANTNDYTADSAGVIYFEDFEKYDEGNAEGVVDNFKKIPIPSEEPGYQRGTNAKVAKGSGANTSKVLAVNIPSNEDSAATKNVDFVLSFMGMDEYTSVIENGVLEVSFKAMADSPATLDSGIVSFAGKTANDAETLFPGTETTNYTFKKAKTTYYGYNLSGQSKSVTLGSDVKWSDWHEYTAVMSVENGLVKGIDHFVDNNLVIEKATPSKGNSPAPGLLKIRPARGNVGSTVYVDDVTVVGYDKKFDDTLTQLNIKETYDSSFELPSSVNGVSIVYDVEENPYVTVDKGQFNVIQPARGGDAEITAYAVMSYNNGGSYPANATKEFVIKVKENPDPAALNNELAREDLAALEITGVSLNNIDADFTVPVKGSINNSDITWSADAEWLNFDKDGKVTVNTPPYTGQIGRAIIITASVKNSTSEVYTKTFEARVLEAAPESDEEKVQYEKSNLKFKVDLTDVRTNIELPVATYANVEWVSNNTSIIEVVEEEVTDKDGKVTGTILTGKVTPPPNGEKVVKLTAVITSGSVSATKDFEVTVKSQNVVKAFPGAEGYGSLSKGGRGGYVYHVTNLSSDSNTKGSLGYGMEKLSGARTIVFDVAGTIDMGERGKGFKLSGEKGSNVTIAGQTAPYPGIQLKGYGLGVSNVHDVVIRHIRIRIGDVFEDGYLEQSDPLSASAVKDTIFDHCSFAWHVDMGFRITGENVTLSNSILSKGLDQNSPHDKGGGHNYAGAFGSRKASFIKNYVSDSSQRSPRLVDGEYVNAYNNLLYNCNYGFDVTNYEWMGVNILDSLHDNFAQDGPGFSNQKGKFIRINRGRDYAGGVLLYGQRNFSTADKSDVAIDNTGTAANYLKSYYLDSTGFDGGSIKYTLQFGEDNTKLINGSNSKYTDDYDLSNVTLEEWINNPLSYDNNNKVSPGATVTFLPYPLPAPRENLVNNPSDSPSVASEKIFNHVVENVGATKPARDLQDAKFMAEAKSKSGGKATLSRELVQEYCDNMNTRTQYVKVFNPETNTFDSVKKNVYDIDETMALLADPEKPMDPSEPQNPKYDPDKPEELPYYYDLWSDRAKDFFVNGDNHAYVDGRSTNNLKPTIYKNEGDKIAWSVGKGEGPLIIGCGSDKSGGAATPIAIKWNDSWWEEFVGFPKNADMIYHTNADIPAEYRTPAQNANLGEVIVWDSMGDGIPDWYKDIRGWDKKREMNGVYLESGYTCLEEYLAFMAGDEEFDAVTNNEGTIAENFNVNEIGYCTAQPYWNTLYRAKCTIYYDTKSSDTLDGYTYNEAVKYTSKTNGYNTYHSIVLAELESDTQYYYRVVSVDEFGKQTISEEQTFKTTPLPGAITPEPPVVQIARPYINQVYLKWTGNVQTDESYRVRYGTESGKYTEQTEIFDRKTYETTITGLEDGQKYYFVVEAMNERGSTISEEVSSTPSNSLVYYNYPLMTDKEREQYLAQTFIYNLGGTVTFKEKAVADGKTILEYHDTTQSHGVESWINFPVNQDETFTTEIRLMLERHKPTFGTDEHATFQINFYMDNEVDESGSSLNSRDFTSVYSVIFDQGEIKFNNKDTLAQYNTIAVPYTSNNTTALKESDHFNKVVKTPLTMDDLTSGRVEWIDLKIVADCENNLITVYKNDDEVGSGLIFNEDVDGPYNVGRIQFKTRLDGNLVANVESVNIYSGEVASDGVEDNMNNLIGTDAIVNVGQGMVPSVGGNASTGGAGGSGGGAGGGGGGSTGGSDSAPDATADPNATDAPAATTAPVDKVDEMFDDLTDVSWAKTAINELAKDGIVNGVADKQFAPLSDVTRAQFVTMLMRAFEKDTEVSSDVKFSDVADGEWYTESVSKAAALGVVKGMDDGSFGVDELITRQDMMVMAYRLLAQKGIDVEEIHEAVSFADDADIAEYAKDAVTSMYKAGIINGVGDNMLNPKGMANRAEAAKILYELKNVAAKAADAEEIASETEETTDAEAEIKAEESAE